MKQCLRFTVLLLAVVSAAQGIIIRHDRDDARYLELGKKYPAVVFMTPDGEGTLIGSAGLHVDPPHRHAEIGYVLGIDRWGKGYATEAARAIVEFGFGTLRLHRLHAGYYTRNPASRRVLEKLGFREEGRRPQMYMRFGEWVDLVLVGMLRQEWERGGDTMRL